MIDTHAHLDMPEFDRDRNEVIDRAKNAGVDTIITVGIDLESSRKAINLAAQHPGIYATAGFHPQEAGLMTETELEELGRLAASPRVVAIGEIGLDYYRKRTPREKQLQVLRWQLDLAFKIQLPVVVHCRDAHIDMLPELRKWIEQRKSFMGRPPGVIHCFNGAEDVAQSYLEMGFYIAFGSYIGYPSSQLNNVIRMIPENRLLVETDCPFLPPQIHRGKRNEPSYIPLTIQVLAALRGSEQKGIEQVTVQNARTLFNL